MKQDSKFIPSHIHDIVRYYNEKYYSRPKIHIVAFDADKPNDLFINLTQLNSSINSGPIKVIITHQFRSDVPNTKFKNGDFIHSEFGIFDGTNLVMMRNSWLMDGAVYPWWNGASKHLRENGIVINLPKVVLNMNERTKQNFPYLSYQGGDRTACHIAAILTAKDVDAEKLIKYSQFKDGFELPPEVLKYSATQNYIIGQIGIEAFKEKTIKHATVSLESYFNAHTYNKTEQVLLEDGKTEEKQIFNTRTSEKTNKFIKMFNK